MVSTVICDGQNSFDIHDTEGCEFSKQITQAFYLELFTLPCALVRWLQGHLLPFYPIQDNSAVSKQSLRVAITISMQLDTTWEVHTSLCKFLERTLIPRHHCHFYHKSCHADNDDGDTCSRGWWVKFVVLMLRSRLLQLEMARPFKWEGG